MDQKRRLRIEAGRVWRIAAALRAPLVRALAENSEEAGGMTIEWEFAGDAR